MKLSLKVEYACQVLAALGGHFGRPELPHIEELAEAECIPSNYLVQILNELRTAGLITSRRGKQGGYALAREPKSITLYDIVCAVESDLLEYSTKGRGRSAARTAWCWSEVAKVMEARARSLTVEDLMKPSSDSMWFI